MPSPSSDHTKQTRLSTLHLSSIPPACPRWSWVIGGITDRTFSRLQDPLSPPLATQSNVPSHLRVFLPPATKIIVTAVPTCLAAVVPERRAKVRASVPSAWLPTPRSSLTEPRQLTGGAPGSTQSADLHAHPSSHAIHFHSPPVQVCERSISPLTRAYPG